MQFTKILSLGLLLAGSSLIARDVVTLQDGSRLVGSLIRMEQGELVFETAFAGQLTLPQAQVASLETTGETFVEFSDGSRARGVVGGRDGQVQVNGANQTTGDLAQVEAIWQVDAPSPETRNLESQLRHWTYEIAAGLSGKTGNSEAFGTDLSGQAVLQGPTDRLRFYGRYRYSEVDGQKDQDDARGGVDYRQDFYNDVLWYVRAEFGRDDVRDLDLYTQAAGGLGYRLIDRDIQHLTFLGGLAHRYEAYASGRTESFPALDLALEHDYNFGWAEMFNNVSLGMSLSDMNQYQAIHTSGIEIPLGTSGSWNLRAGIENEYDGAPEPGNKRMDTTYFTNVVYTFD